MFRSIILLFSALTLIPLTAQAEYGSKGEWEVGPYIGFGFPDAYSPINLENDFLLGGRFGYNLTDCIGAEVSWHRLFAETVRGADANLDSARANVLLNFNKGHRFRPFLTAGLGAEMSKIGSLVDDVDFGWNAGAGAKLWLYDWIGLRGDVRYWGVDVSSPVDGIQHNAELMIGMFFSFGGEDSKPAPAPVVEGDADADGVKDGADQCPNTPYPAVVDAKGCPKDSDKDGVYDGLDKCEGTPAGAKVDAQGCEVKTDADSDGDGVMDSRDKCPGTPKGEKVDDMGCPEKVAKARGALKGVNFETSSATLKAESFAVLDEVAAVLKEFRDFRVEVQGHTDSVGDNAMNLDLSKRRAQTVADYLTAKGVDGKRFDVKGYGESKPVAPNNTKEGRLQNRRVELNWLN